MHYIIGATTFLNIILNVFAELKNPRELYIKRTLFENFPIKICFEDFNERVSNKNK